MSFVAHVGGSKAGRPDGDAEQALVAELAKWRRNAEQVERLVKFGSFEAGLDAGGLTWSDGTYAVFGVPAGSPITLEEALAFYDAATRDRIQQGIERAKASGEPYDLTVPFRTRAGENRWARMVGQVEIVAGSKRLFGVIRDVTSERIAEEHLRQQALQDMLTGLPNRRAFQARLEQVQSTGVERLGLCIVDVDRFKSVNDGYGHEVGDLLLKLIASRLAAAVRTTDLVARLGGDEFAIVLTGLQSKADLQRRVSSVITAVREPGLCADHMLTPSVSIGASCSRTLSPDHLLKQADIALYKAKLNGRDQYCLFEPRFRKEVEAHDRLADEVRTGLARNQFEVHYQPIVDLRTRIVRGWEALVRWRHPQRGLLLPERFAAALSDPKTSVAIDDFVLDTSLRQMRQWLDRAAPVTCLGVNVSEAQLKRPDLVERIMTGLDRHRLTPDRLKLEISEAALGEPAARSTAATMDSLAELGVVCVLDDFGMGHASLTRLKQFRVERIKLNRAFMANVGIDGYDQAIVRCMIGLGRDLGIRITAEGIETVDQLAVLRQFGCDVGQGFLFGRPMPSDDVPGFLERWEARAASLFDAVEQRTARPRLVR
ncbi:putative bifunctional diguanylate cyclase/phosphodiesterase [Lichenihabitans psoromatis]|uniref:putative bifunctional diguanylate cyclase/phosphodiesterase n=1 Tax=Lichenihabitans psoromatis TaxID=2528642 RepID=UPI0010367FF2|nr:EAL domain-containing protein [Lichenihabitans psoromatis]